MEAVVAKKFPEMSTLLRFCSKTNAMSSSLALFASLLRGFEASFTRELRSVRVHSAANFQWSVEHHRRRNDLRDVSFCTHGRGRGRGGGDVRPLAVVEGGGRGFSNASGKCLAIDPRRR